MFFALSRAALTLSMIFFVGAWLTSDILKSKNPDAWNRQSRKRATLNDFRKFRLWKYVPALSFIVLFGAIWALSSSIQTTIDLARLHGRLMPSDDPTPSNSCQEVIKDDSFVAFLGDLVAVSQTLPATVLRINDKDALTLNRNEDGTMGLSLRIEDQDKKIIVLIENGEFKINPNNIFKMERPDYSTLKVIDQFGTIVLNVRYINKRAMWVDAKIAGVTLDGSHTLPWAICVGNPQGEAMYSVSISGNKIRERLRMYIPN